ncbi:hypothetical protein F4861DRAFT_37794 [Xylaria intraflava]|nr:hypothetical protein F4861DRAFT_37794 [Xylaria intraflava]
MPIRQTSTQHNTNISTIHFSSLFIIPLFCPVPAHIPRVPTMAPTPPRNWVIYVVARISGHYRTLAVSCLRDNVKHGVDGAVVISICERAKALFEDPSNSIAIATERSLAEIFYSEKEVEAIPLPDTPEMENMSYLAHCFWPSGLLSPQNYCREFPFVTTCLTLIANAARQETTNLRHQPIGSVFCFENPFFGMVVFDVTNTEKISYGIVALDTPGFEAYPTPKQLDTLAQLRLTPLTAREFAEIFQIKNVRRQLEQLDNTPVIGWSAFKYIWPLPTIQRSINRPRPPKIGPRPLVELALGVLVEYAFETRLFDMNLITEVRQLPMFRAKLRQELEQCEDLSTRCSVPQLIAVAFDKETHLNLVKMKGISADTIRAALRMKELSHVTAISICIEYLSSTSAEFAEMLFSRARNYDIYVCQLPRRISNVPSIDFLMAICRGRDRLDRRVFFSGIYSASLQGVSWMPSVTISESEFPLRYIYYKKTRQALVQGVFRPETDSKRFYVRDGLLCPHRAVGALFKLLLVDDPNLLDITTAPPVEATLNTDRMVVSPIPVLHGSTSRSLYWQFHRGSWHLLVSKTEGYGSHWHVMYAFVQVQADVGVFNWEDGADDEGIIRVCTAQEFLEATTGEPLDASEAKIIDDQLAEIGSLVASGSGELGPKSAQAVGRMGIEQATRMFLGMVTMARGMHVV